MEKDLTDFPTIWIDADSCPKAVRDITIRFSHRKNPLIKVIFVANKQIPASSTEYQMIICEKEKDSADNYILNNVKPQDLVITRDILFAEKLVNKNICAINDRGTYFNKDNIKDLVEDRNFDLQLAEIGFTGTKMHSYNKKQLAKFTSCFEIQLNRLLKAYSLTHHQELP